MESLREFPLRFIGLIGELLQQEGNDSNGYREWKSEKKGLPPPVGLQGPGQWCG
jgi:hypothetical protein